jgi:hypothetical protein
MALKFPITRAVESLSIKANAEPHTTNAVPQSPINNPQRFV